MSTQKKIKSKAKVVKEKNVKKIHLTIVNYPKLVLNDLELIVCDYG